MDKFKVKLIKKDKRANKNMKIYRVYIRANENKEAKDMEMMTMDDVEFIHDAFVEKFNDEDITMIQARNPYRMTSVFQDGHTIDPNDDYAVDKVNDGYDTDKFNNYYYINIYTFG